MSNLYFLVHTGVRCDPCARDLDGPESTDSEYHDRLAVEAGWRVFAGRSKRHYCPDCNPKPGHKMWEITDRYRREVAR